MKRKASFQEKRERLQTELEGMKQRLLSIEEKRKNELGELLLTCGLAENDDSILEKEFKALSEKLKSLHETHQQISP